MIINRVPAVPFAVAVLVSPLSIKSIVSCLSFARRETLDWLFDITLVSDLLSMSHKTIDAAAERGDMLGRRFH